MLKPVEIGPLAYESWKIEAQLIQGLDTGSLPIDIDTSLFQPVFTEDSNMLLSGKEAVVIFCRARAFQMARQIRESLVTTGLLKCIKITK